MQKVRKVRILSYEIADNLWKWIKGLMFSKPKTLIFDFKKTREVKIHMWFVFFPIYAIVLDENKKVIKIKKLYPFISFFKFNGRYLIEMPEKEFKKYKITLNDLISF
ncbi:MAG: DUF192 domain-containing protein [Candidatus Woesearchaeota archaeon]